MEAFLTTTAYNWVTMADEALRFQARQLSKIQLDYDELYEKFKQVAVHVASLQNLNDTLTRANGDLKEKLALQRRKRKESENEYRNDVAKLRSAEALLIKREEEIEEIMRDLKRHNTGIEAINNQLTEDNERYRNIIANESMPLEVHNHIISTKDNEILYLTGQINMLETQIEKDCVARAEYVSLEAQVKDTLQDVEQKEQALEAVKSQYYEASERISGLGDEVVILRDENQRVIECRDNFEATIKELKSELEMSEKVIQENRVHIISLENAKSSLLIQVGNLKQSKRRESGDFGTLQRTIDSLQSDNETLKFQSEDAENRRKSLESALLKNTEDTAVTKTETHMLTLDKDRLILKNDELEGRLHDLQQAKAAQEGVCGELKRQKLMVETALAKVHREKEREKEKLVRSEKLRTEAESICEELFAQKAAAQAAETELQKKVHEMGERLEMLHHTKEEVETRRDALSDEKDSLEGSHTRMLCSVYISSHLASEYCKYCSMIHC